jgi:hypothetical protein
MSCDCVNSITFNESFNQPARYSNFYDYENLFINILRANSEPRWTSAGDIILPGGHLTPTPVGDPLPLAIHTQDRGRCREGIETVTPDHSEGKHQILFRGNLVRFAHGTQD